MPIFFIAEICISIGREPSSQPPGILTVHSPVLPKIAPIKIIDERISRISFSGISVTFTSAESITAVLLENLHLQPRQLSILDAEYMSVSSGQLLITDSSPHRIELAIIGRLLFLLPCNFNSPLRRLPPFTISFCIIPPHSIFCILCSKVTFCYFFDFSYSLSITSRIRLSVSLR